ncbi:hypothetical protein UFOVP672_40 [uncultured Caudovirales phage]|uniref:Uncharacterized protein n=1 Tax=uncultured Caudovirales phage TaxID=2100421 RepID=A0A6J5NDT7_9CAUD|nr:hypothetical protein UFOVP672_40 [uncultured Caudovirales phage]
MSKLAIETIDLGRLDPLTPYESICLARAVQYRDAARMAQDQEMRGYYKGRMRRAALQAVVSRKPSGLRSLLAAVEGGFEPPY